MTVHMRNLRPYPCLAGTPSSLFMAQAALSGVPFITAYEELVRVRQLRNDETLRILLHQPRHRLYKGCGKLRDRREFGSP